MKSSAPIVFTLQVPCSVLSGGSFWFFLPMFHETFDSTMSSLKNCSLCYAESGKNPFVGGIRNENNLLCVSWKMDEKGYTAALNNSERLLHSSERCFFLVSALKTALYGSGCFLLLLQVSPEKRLHRPCPLPPDPGL